MVALAVHDCAASSEGDSKDESIAHRVRLVFDYYNRLSARRQSIYRQSDEIRQVRLPQRGELLPVVPELEAALKSENRGAIEKLSRRIADEIVSQLKAPGIRVQVLAVRPSDDWGELHGLYLPEDESESAKIQLWMRTVKHKKVVAFRSFLRTLLHELCHLEHHNHGKRFYALMNRHMADWELRRKQLNGYLPVLVQD